MERHKSRKQQSTDDESAEIEAVSFKKFSLDVNSLTRVSVSVYYINVQPVLCMHGNFEQIGYILKYIGTMYCT